MSERLRVRRFGRALTGVATLFAVAGLTLAAAGAAAYDDGVLGLEPAPDAGLVAGGEPQAAEDTGLWFVELGSAPVAKGTSKAQLDKEHAAFRKAASEAGIGYTERFAFQRLWNGLSIQADGSQVASISRVDGVKAVYPVVTVSIPPTSGISPELATAINQTGANLAQAAGWTGAGVKVAVMDTGVDYDHADLGGDGVSRLDSRVFPTSRVVAGWDFVGDKFRADSASPLYDPNPKPDPYPDDCNGHGTHVAGIVGASGNPATGGARGVAPGVTFGAYRVFGCEGSTTADIMIAAMERALADGMHVLNMSIGSAFVNWDQYPTAAASNELVDAGVIVVASIGNSGADGVASAGAPGVGRKVIGVASFDNTHVALRTFTVDPAGLEIGYGNAAAAPEAPTSGSLPLAKSGTPTSAADGCSVGGVSPFTAGQFAGQAVLIRRGTCTFFEKASNAANAGAAAVVLYNNVAGRISPTVAPGVSIPVVAVSDLEGVAINNAIEAAPQTLTWTPDTGVFENPTANLISSFSSYGLGAELDLKPDIGAPGGLIRSTYPLQSGGYATVSGTSMSSPHTAGSVALLLQAKPGLSAAEVRDRLQNTADPKVWQGNPGLGFLDQVHRQGAGMVQINSAINAPTWVSPGKIVLGEAGAAVTTTLTLRNASGSPITYTPSNQAALGTFGSIFAPSATTSAAVVSFGAPTVTVPANGSATIDVTITRPDFGALNKVIYGGYVRFTPTTPAQSLRVPYAGFGGDYQGFPVMVGLTPHWNEAQTVSLTGGPTGGTFTLTFTPPGGGAAQTTAPIAHNATAVAVRTALEALAGIGVGNVAASGGPLPGAAVTVTFQNTLGNQNIAELTGTSSLTGGTSPGVAVATARNGQASFPKLAKRVGFVSDQSFVPTYSFPTGSPVYTMKPDNVFGRLVRDVPTVALHLDQQARWIKVTLLNADGSSVSGWGALSVDPTAIFSEFVARNSTLTGFFALEWDGRLSVLTKQGKATQKVAPKGDYKFLVEMLKAGGDAGTAGHVETYTSPVFTIQHGS